MPNYPDDDNQRLACIGHDPEIFFDEAARFAKRICKGVPAKFIPGCPVIDQCLAAALERREEYGVFGGLDATERKQLLARKATA